MSDPIFDEAIAPVRPRPFRLAVDVILADVSTDHVAKVMSVSDRTVQRWKKGQLVDGYTGDKLAVKVCGVDGWSLWGNDFDRAFAAIDALDFEDERLSA